MQIQALLFVAVLAGVWLFAIRRPELYLKLLFVAAPWHGLFVSLVWNLDAFKIGLLLAPVALLLCPPRQNSTLLRILALLLAYALALAVWQAVFAQDMAIFDLLGYLSLWKRMAASNYLFVCRVLLVFIVVGAVRTRESLQGCAAAYVGSTFVLALYGLAQEATFLTVGHPITPMYPKGIFGDAQRFVTTDFFGVAFLRVHAFCMEPKDFALFMAPSIAFVWASLSVGERGLRHRLIQWTQLVVMTVAAVLTFSTSLLLVAPLILLGTEFSGRGGRRSARRLALVGAVVLATWPVLHQLWLVRVEQRLTSGETTLLQRSREAPAAEFFSDQLPRSLVGYGVGTQAFYLPAYMPSEFRDMVVSSEVAAGIDSFWFTVLLDLGLPGLILVGMACFEGVRAPRGAKWAWPYRAALLAIMVMCVPQQGDLRSGIIWLFLGLTWRANWLAKIADMHCVTSVGPSPSLSWPRSASAWQRVSANYGRTTHRY